MKTALFTIVFLASTSAFARMEMDRHFPETKSNAKVERQCPETKKPSYSVSVVRVPEFGIGAK